MIETKESRYHNQATRCKYAPLYHHLRQMRPYEWRTTFGEIESILGFGLPSSARVHRTWWGNQNRNNGRSQALAWGAAGWGTSNVDAERETLVFRRRDLGENKMTQHPKVNLNDILPSVDMGAWPEGFTVSREQIYGDWA